MGHSFDYDFIVIGAGSGGVRAARIAAGHGAKVAVIEESRAGGTCVIRGCVPKKLLVFGASFPSEFEDAAGFGWQMGEAQHSWPDLIAAKDKEIDRLEGIYRNLLKNAGATLIDGRGTLAGPHQVSVNGDIITAERILIAVGGWPSIPDIPGLKDNAITSNEALDLPQRPQKIIIQGGGYIALEFASIFNGLGSEVHLIYRADYPLRGFDDDVRKHVSEALGNRGINLRPHTNITQVKAGIDGKVVTLDDGSQLVVDEVMSAAGRAPNSTGLGLEELGVALAENGAVQVDDYGQTSVPSIYAVGDVTDRVNLTPVALGEGHALADSLFGGNKRTISHEMIASAVFCLPQIASVGVSEEEAEKQGDITVYESKFRAMRNTLSGRDEQSYMKLIVRQSDDRIMGVHMVGPDSAEIMQGIAIAVKMGATKADFDATIGIHPTAAEEFVTMRSPRSS
ncbi:MAG: glutathione-disulfide reductase [Candidatus Puniceispirillaceae bacterium]